MTEQDRLSRNNRKLTELNAWLRPKALAILRMMLAASARAHGLETGIRFGLSAANRAAMEAALNASLWHYKGKTGWDPWHVQPKPQTLTVANARAGKRPL